MHSQHVDTIHILGSSKMLLGKGYCYANKKLINCLSGFIDTYKIELSKSDKSEIAYYLSFNWL